VADVEINISQEVLMLIAEIDEFKGKWRALNTLAPDRLAALRKIATIESVGSSTRIEGARLSDRQVQALLANLGQQSFTSRDEQEVAGYAEVMDVIFSSWESIPFSENYIKQFHTMLLRYSPKDVGVASPSENRHRGEYKKFENSVQAFDGDGNSLGIVFETTSPFDTPREMEELVTQTASRLISLTMHPLLAISVFVVTFLAIHPFQDGNGRLSRILTTLLLLKAGYGYVPYASIESIIEESKEGYYLALRQTQGTLKPGQVPNWEPWLLFFLRVLKRQKTRLQTKLDNEQIMAASLPLLSVRILELAKEQGRVTAQGIEQVTGESRGTIKLRLKQLTEDRLLVRYGKGRSTWYGMS
jgi:Fic family protein